MTTASKKIAFIGCSHFAGLEQPTQGKDNWTYQLSLLFPQHEYRNYSKGGQGIQGYQLALLDAKIWGADIIFMNRTYMGRWQLELDISNHKFEYHVSHKIGDNWTEYLANFTHIWGSVNSGPNYHLGPNDGGYNQESNDIQKYFNDNQGFWRVQHNNNPWRLDWELKWYGNVEKLYNFENFFLIDWTRASHQVPNEEGCEIPTMSSTTWDIDVETHFTKGKSSYKTLGITVSEEDQHLNPHGNLRLLNEYILTNPKVKKSLDT